MFIKSDELTQIFFKIIGYISASFIGFHVDSNIYRQPCFGISLQPERNVVRNKKPKKPYAMAYKKL